MTHYLNTGNSYKVVADDALNVLDTLPAATYTVKKDQMTGELFLQTTNNFELPSKIYGNPIERADRVINTFLSRPRTTGVLLSGDKGSGKTLLTKKIALDLIEQNIPIIVVNEPFCGPEFNSLIERIQQPAMVVFDEFDKVYDEEDQQLLLTLLDGTVETKKLFVLTTNDGHVDQHLINRPGRIYYRFHYEGLDESFVREYAIDTLNDKNQIEGLLSVTSSFSTMTFDMLQAVVEEMNRYDSTAIEVLDYINVDITSESVAYGVTILWDGAPVTNTFHPYQIEENPLYSTYRRTLEIYTNDNHTFTPSDEKFLRDLKLTPTTKHQISSGGVITFFFTVKDKPMHVILEKQKRAKFNWGAF